jgi:hypothetical protein
MLALENCKRSHTYCEDGFYSCPKDESYFGNDDSGKCNCGADDVNLLITTALRLGDLYLEGE